MCGTGRWGREDRGAGDSYCLSGGCGEVRGSGDGRRVLREGKGRGGRRRDMRGRGGRRRDMRGRGGR